MILIASNDRPTLFNHASFTPPMQASPLYAIRCKAEVAIADFVKSAKILVGVRSRQMPNAKSSKPNELIFKHNVLQ